MELKFYLIEKLISATPYEAILDNNERIRSRTIVSTVPSISNPLIEGLKLEKKIR